MHFEGEVVLLFIALPRTGCADFLMLFVLSIVFLYM